MLIQPSSSIKNFFSIENIKIFPQWMSFLPAEMGEAWVTQESKPRPKINKQLPLNIQDATIVGIYTEKK